jgi:hypothetical protein
VQAVTPKRIATFCLALALSWATPPALASGTLDAYDALLARYVTPEGVRYDAWRSAPGDLERLAQVVADLEATDPDALDPDARAAFYVNLYNASTVHLILTAEEPPESIRDLSGALFGWGIFFKKLVSLDGERISLNALEKRLLRVSGDPRVHFAVNCASRSCPPLAAEAYRGSRLDEQLDRQTRAFLSSGHGLVVGDRRRDGRLTVRVSKLFDWYSGDFKPAGGTLAFLVDHAPPATSSLLDGGGVKLTYLDYDWSLNAAP